MKYLHIKKLEEYNPGYKDRELYWCKAHFKMLNADPEFEMLCEIDKWRFMALIMLEMQNKSPIPLDSDWLARKGFDLKARKLDQTLANLSQMIEIATVTEEKNVCTEDLKVCAQSREEKSREEKSRCALPMFDFESVWSKYPRKLGKVNAERHFIAQVVTVEDYGAIKTALDKFLASKVCQGDPQYIPYGSTWFNNVWRDWINYQEPGSFVSEEQELIRKAGLSQDEPSNRGKRSYN